MEPSGPTIASNRVVFPCIFLILLVLFGYSKIFAGYNFYIHEDWVALSNHTSGNRDSNGWRPDKGLGVSNFYGDPGMWHPWAFFSFLEKVTPSREWSHLFSVIVLDILAALALLFFVRRFFPQINLWLAAILAPLVVFCFDAPAQHYSRHFISLTAVIPVFLWLLYDYYRRPRWLHIFLSAFLVWAVAFFGNLWALTQLLMLGFIFTLIYRLYFKAGGKKIVQQFFVLYGLSVPMVLLLGAWVFYSFGLEQAVVGYVREKSIPFGNLGFIPQLKPLISYLCGFFPFEGIPMDHNLAAFNYLPYRLNVSVIFIFAFLFFLGRKSESFWEFALKSLLVIFFVHGVLYYGKLIPAYGAIFGFITSKTSTLFTMFMFVFSIETILIILFIAIVSPGNVIPDRRWCRNLQVLIASVTLACYASVFVIAFMASFFPAFYHWISDHWLPSLLPATLGGYSKELLTYMLSYNARRFEELIRPELFFFFLTSMLIVGVFLKDSWLRRAAALPKILIAFVLVFNAILLSWSLYPLNNRPLAWARPEVKALQFDPTDRFYFVRYFKWDKSVEGFKKKWEVADGHGPRKNLAGYLEPPGLNISGFKSFTNKAEAEFMKNIFRQSGRDYVRLYYGAHFVHSKLLDMAAVKYYYSDNVIENLPPSIVPFAQFEQLYIYKNTLAWPYYYSARRLQAINGPLLNPEQGTAYLQKDDLLNIPDMTDAGHVQLNTFGSGKLIFDVDNRQEAFLVVADAWHPFWKAQLPSGEQLKVYKTNEIFKGVRLPAGKYQFKLFFDTRPYQPGIWISMIAWILWLFGFYRAWRSRRGISWLM